MSLVGMGGVLMDGMGTLCIQMAGHGVIMVVRTLVAWGIWAVRRWCHFHGDRESEGENRPSHWIP